MQLIEIDVYGRRIRVVDPASVGLRQHTLGTFRDHEPVLERFCRRVKPNDVVIDAGACFGSYALPALAAGARVIAYEPCDDGITLLMSNAAATLCHSEEEVGRQSELTAMFLAEGLNDFMVPGISSACGLPFRLRRAILWTESENYPADLLGQVFGQHYPASDTTSIVSLDRDLERLKISRVDWIKSDVEGAERGLIEGALETIRRHHPTLIVELHEGVSNDPNDAVSRYPERDGSNAKIRAMLHAEGYELEFVPWDVSRMYLVAEHPSRRAAR